MVVEKKRIVFSVRHPYDRITGRMIEYVLKDDINRGKVNIQKEDHYNISMAVYPSEIITKDRVIDLTPEEQELLESAKEHINNYGILSNEHLFELSKIKGVDPYVMFSKLIGIPSSLSGPLLHASAIHAPHFEEVREHADNIISKLDRLAGTLNPVVVYSTLSDVLKSIHIKQENIEKRAEKIYIEKEKRFLHQIKPVLKRLEQHLNELIKQGSIPADDTLKILDMINNVSSVQELDVINHVKKLLTDIHEKKQSTRRISKMVLLRFKKDYKDVFKNEIEYRDMKDRLINTLEELERALNFQFRKAEHETVQETYYSIVKDMEEANVLPNFVSKLVELSNMSHSDRIKNTINVLNNKKISNLPGSVGLELLRITSSVLNNLPDFISGKKKDKLYNINNKLRELSQKHDIPPEDLALLPVVVSYSVKRTLPEHIPHTVFTIEADADIYSKVKRVIDQKIKYLAPLARARYISNLEHVP